MARSTASHGDTSIETYRTKRDFKATAEPRPAPRSAKRKQPVPIFVVQKHHAHRAGLHWDFRLEHNNVLLSWAVRKGPSLDPTDKRIAVHVEDHPLDYAQYQGTIPEGQYGAGKVETWDRGTWEPLVDPDAGLRNGEIKFVLSGQRLHGKFTLVRLKPKPNQRGRQDNWLLIKGHDGYEQPGMDAESLEASVELSDSPKKTGGSPPIGGAIRGRLPDKQAPQLATVVDGPPEEDDWLTEIKFDGYRLLASVDQGEVRLLTRNGNDWTDRLPAVASAIAQLPVNSVRVDGELVALDKQGVSSFPALQTALSNGHDETLVFYLFDLLHLDGWDLRPCALRDRKQRLRLLRNWQGMLRYSDHHEGDAARMRKAACQMKLEGIICKRADAPYRAGRSHDWLKVKCQGREEFLVLGWTEPAGSRTGLGSLHLGYYDESGGLHYAGGCGSGFSDELLGVLRERLNGLGNAPPQQLILAGEDLEPNIHWVKPDLVAETNFTSWSGAGRVRHAVFLGLRDDKSPHEVIREPADPEAEHRTIKPRVHAAASKRNGPIIAVPPKRAPQPAAPRARSSEVGPTSNVNRPLKQRKPEPDGFNPMPSGSERAAAALQSGAIVTARAPKARTETIEGVTLTHPDRELWPGITKRDLAQYWQTITAAALPGLAHRPLAILRCPEGVAGEHFFQKHSHGAMPPGIREDSADKAPFLLVDGLPGLVGMAQMSAVELHVWGATEADPLHADQLVFDLDPGEGVAVADIVAAALDVHDQLQYIGLQGFCRTSGGKGLHVVVPLVPGPGWDEVRAFCKSFAEGLSQTRPDKYLAHVKIADRHGRILIDWLRNGLGSTAVASFCPRARQGAGVATPLAWKEVKPKLDLAAFTMKTVPARLTRLRSDPWAGFEEARRKLPAAPKPQSRAEPAPRSLVKARIVTAKAPQPIGRKG